MKEKKLIGLMMGGVVDRLADSEDELHRYKASLPPLGSPSGGQHPIDRLHAHQTSDGYATFASSRSPPSSPGRSPPNNDRTCSRDDHSSMTNNHPNRSSSSTSQPSSTLPNRLPSFLSSRRRPPAPRSTCQSNSTATTPTDLEAALHREQTLRQQAEGRLSQANGELEELSAQLFQQANEMVATERRARAKLEERVELLERRDREKRQRLERLEGAVNRIERVRGLLAAPH